MGALGKMICWYNDNGGTSRRYIPVRQINRKPKKLMGLLGMLLIKKSPGVYGKWLNKGYQQITYDGHIGDYIIHVDYKQ